MQTSRTTFSPSKYFVVVFVLAIFCLNAMGQDPIETIRIEADLVDLKVSVLGFPQVLAAPLLDQKDFVVLEDGKQQDIAFFAAADAPFDLVLLLDLSGSNQKKLKMIRNSAKRFIDSARPVDRIALVTFTDRPALYSSFSLDRKKLKQSVDEMDEAIGGTNFWDAMNYVLGEMIGNGPTTRRSAIVLMTDGVDNALPEVPGPGSEITFDRLLEKISTSETMIFPIYLDTETENVKSRRIPREAYVLARDQLGQIASRCGTTLYKASKIGDLDQVYGRVIRDLSTVYSIGYRPSNKTPDGKWRSVEVQLPQFPDLLARTRRGYFAKLETDP
jgi:VWFA-related protein